MTGQLIMFELEILTDTTDVISSLGSADGTTPCRCAGTKDLFGQAHVPVSPSARPARARVPMTSVICGLRGFLSSASASLQGSLESRLRRRLDGAGSTLFSLIWRRKATPAHRPYFQLAASARRTSGSEFGSWPTPAATDEKNGSINAEWHRRRGNKGIRLNDHVLQRGPISNGYPAPTAKRGQLNPAHSRWLMGYPAEWDACAPTATR